MGGGKSWRQPRISCKFKRFQNTHYTSSNKDIRFNAVLFPFLIVFQGSSPSGRAKFLDLPKYFPGLELSQDLVERKLRYFLPLEHARFLQVIQGFLRIKNKTSNSRNRRVFQVADEPWLFGWKTDSQELCLWSNNWGGSRGGSGGSHEPPKVKRKYFYHTFFLWKRRRRTYDRTPSH